MNQQPVIKNIRISIVALLTLSPLVGEIVLDRLELRIKSLKVEEIPKFLDEVYKSEDLKTFEEILRVGDKKLIQHLKIRLGNMRPSKLRDKLIVLALNSPQSFWSGNPPSSGSGTIEFAVRRVVFETLTKKIGLREVEYGGIEKKAIRLSWATKLEAVIIAAEAQDKPKVP